MVVLGLGSNLGDRLANLRQALKMLRNTPGIAIEQISPIYLSDALLPENAPLEWNKPFLNVALRCHVTLEPHDLLTHLKRIELSIGRKPLLNRWGPRIIDIDMLIWDNLVIHTDKLHLPHKNLVERPFALWPLADVAPFWTYPLPGPNQGKTAATLVEQWGSRFEGQAPFRTRQLAHRIDTPQLMGIVNITPDSFSDGNQFFAPEDAVKQAQALVQGGAEIIDLGAESTAPKASAIDANTEWERLKPVLSAIKAVQNEWVIKPKISIDTRHAEVALKALDFGIDWLNDVTGLDDPAMREVVRQSSLDCVIMHHLSIPERRDHVLPRHIDPIQSVYNWAENRLNELEQSGFSRENLIFDPGIGFGKMAEQSFFLLKNCHVFKKLGTRILIGHSRKTFLSLFSRSTFAERDLETALLALYLAQQSIDYLRVHNVEMCAQVFKIHASLPQAYEMIQK